MSKRTEHREERVENSVSSEMGSVSPDADWSGKNAEAAPGTGENPPKHTEEAARKDGKTAASEAGGPDRSPSGSSAGQTKAGEGSPSGIPGGQTDADEGSPPEGDLQRSPEEQIAELQAKLAEANDLYLRKAADFENYRKRMNQEKQSAIDFANQTLLLDLIPVIDDFERAIKSAEDQGQDPEQISTGFKSLCEGIGMIEKRLVTELENKWGLKRYDSAGEPFDPSRHEAIMMEKSAGITDPVVAEEYIKGYSLKERVIRPAKVKVIMPDG